MLRIGAVNLWVQRGEKQMPRFVGNIDCWKNWMELSEAGAVLRGQMNIWKSWNCWKGTLEAAWAEFARDNCLCHNGLQSSRLPGSILISGCRRHRAFSKKWLCCFE